MKLKVIILIAVLFFTIAGFAETPEKGLNTKQQPQVVMTERNTVFAPHLRVNGYAFYAFNDKVDSRYSATEYYYGTIKGGFQWGGGLEYLIAPSRAIELSYLRLDTHAPMTYYDIFEKYTDFDVATNFIMLGGNRYFPTGKIEPYVGAQLGLAILNVKNPNKGNSGNATKFAWGIKAGVNIWVTDKVGLKLQTGLLSAIQAAGGSLYFGTGGAGAGVNTYSTFYQFYIGGGLSFDLAK